MLAEVYVVVIYFVGCVVVSCRNCGLVEWERECEREIKKRVIREERRFQIDF